MSDERDPPIETRDFIGGVNVVDFGDMRVARGFTRREHSTCPHNNLRYDQNERRVWCADCERDVEAFDAFVSLVTHYDLAWKALDRRRKELAEAETFQLRSRAAKAIDLAWRRRDTVPMCPHCHNGLFPEHFARGVAGFLGREYALARLAKDKNR